MVCWWWVGCCISVVAGCNGGVVLCYFNGCVGVVFCCWWCNDCGGCGCGGDVLVVVVYLVWWY